jgi:NitT/TauT family transport system permease protein
MRSPGDETKAPAPPPEAAAGPGPNGDVPPAGAAVVVPTGSEALQVGDLGAGERPRRSPARAALDAFLPNRAVSPATMHLIIAVQVVAALLFWFNSPPQLKILPRPDEVVRALRNLWLHQGLGQDLLTSFGLNLQALGYATLISLGLAYLTVIPFFRPIVTAISKGRFLSLVGFSFIFTLIVGGGRPLKTSLLVFGITVFFVTSMAAVIAAIPKADFDHARTLRMSEWRVVWEVVILGTADKAFEVLRQNAAIGWMMLTMVEGISRSEGGIGAALLNQSKYIRLPEVFGIQILILLVGMLQDYGIGALRRFLCPYADLTLERR